MAVITLSWQYGCLGDLVAEDAAKQLGYKIIGKKEINEMFIKSASQFPGELEVDNSLKMAGEEIEPAFFQRLHREQAAYANLLTSLIYKAASQDRVIIKGYGAQMILAQQPHVFCTRLKGSFDARVSMVRQHRQLDLRTAKELVKKEDQERVEFIQYVFKQELTNLQWYDMVLDIEKIGLKTITEMIVNAARALEESHPLSQTEHSSLGLYALESRLKALVLRKNPEITGLKVSLNSDGVVTIAGRVTDEDKKTELDQLLESLPEVQGVVNNIKVVVPFPSLIPRKFR